ncbi:16973_t:CDS:2 [Entrophospora sp. SA101]|nr:16973_t:CDS:2 [Entrophospora sp. SA101]
MGKVIEQSISEFLESKFDGFKIQKFSDKDLENFSFNNSKIYGNVEIATLKKNNSTVVLKPINVANIRFEVDEIKLMWEAGSDKSTLKLHDASKDEYYLVLEYINCVTLTQYLQNNFKTLDWNKKIKIALDISNALLFLHEHNIFHKNLSSDSILYYRDTIKLINFGIFNFRTLTKKRSFLQKIMKKDNDDSESIMRPKEYDVCSLGSVLFQLTQALENYNGDWDKYLKNLSLEQRDNAMSNVPSEYQDFRNLVGTKTQTIDQIFIKSLNLYNN